MYMGNKVFLVSTPLEEDFKLKHIPDHENSYSLGLGYLHSILKSAGYNIRTQNYNTALESVALSSIEQQLREFQPDFFLVQIFTMNRVTSYKIIKLAKALNQNIKIIIGGVHAAVMYKQILENFPVDFAVIGEGEESVPELLAAICAGSDIANIRGIAHKTNGVISYTGDRELIRDLDKLPFPDHSLFITPKRKMACMLTSRGCPFRCSFCCLHTISKGIYRKRSVANIIAEIEYILTNFKQVDLIQFVDDTFTLDEKRAIDFCNEVIKRKLNVKFWGSGRVKPASRIMFELMEKAGFTWLGFGLETGSESMLKNIHKEVTHADVKNTFSMLKGIDKIQIGLFMMVGFPKESMNTINETIAFLRDLYKIRKFSIRGVAVLWVLPNTEVYEIMKSKNAINDDYWLTDKSVPRYTLEHSYQELKAFSSIIQMSFYTYGGRMYFIAKGIQYFLKNPLLTVKKIFINFRYLLAK